MFSFGLHAEEKRKFTPIKFFDVPAGAERQDLASIPLESRRVAPETIRTYHSTVETAIAKNPAILITLNRMNWFLTKSEFDDSIIDLTIGLESLIPGKDELRYRFSLYLAFVTNRTLRSAWNDLDCLDLCMILEATSCTVVTSIKFPKKREKIRENWEVLTRASLSAINYYLYFISTNGPETWQEHLEFLILAGEPRVVD